MQEGMIFMTVKGLICLWRG